MRCVCVHSLIPLVRSLHAPHSIGWSGVRVIRTMSVTEWFEEKSKKLKHSELSPNVNLLDISLKELVLKASSKTCDILRTPP